MDWTFIFLIPFVMIGCAIILFHVTDVAGR
jgi:hypothetical protein